MIIDKLGWYKTRGGEMAYVGFIFPGNVDTNYPAVGYSENISRTWDLHGFAFDEGATLPEDLVEYLGAKKPKKKRMVEQTIDCFVNVYGKDQHDSGITTDKYYCSLYMEPTTISDCKHVADLRGTPFYGCVPAKLTFSIEEEVDEYRSV